MQFHRLALSSLSWRAVRPAAVIASAYRATLGSRTKLIAVTGSFGKTTTTRAVLAILGQSTRVERVPMPEQAEPTASASVQGGPSLSLGSAQCGPETGSPQVGNHWPSGVGSSVTH